MGTVNNVDPSDAGPARQELDVANDFPGMALGAPRKAHLLAGSNEIDAFAEADSLHRAQGNSVEPNSFSTTWWMATRSIFPSLK